MKRPELAQRFEQIFGTSPKVFRAPGRVNLIGEHTDYNEGFVLPAAIGFYTQVAIAPRSDKQLLIRSMEFAGDFEFDLENLPAKRGGTWCDYVLGVALMLRRRGLLNDGANLLVQGDVPIGAGLSSSAAVEVASAFALLSRGGSQLPTSDVAQLCQQAENTFVGARVGIMDQFVSCMARAGNAFFLDCRSLEFKPVPIPAEIQLVICNTMVKHDLASGSYNTRRQECEQSCRILAKREPTIHSLRDVSIGQLDRYADLLSPVLRKRSTHVVQENQRVLDAVQCLADGDLNRLGHLMRESHRSLRDLYEVSCSELDILVDAAEGLPGHYGGRMTGGGFGGCTVNLVQARHAKDFATQISERYQGKTEIRPDVYICSAVEGAQALI